jgi:copper(I)-binding protein
MREVRQILAFLAFVTGLFLGLYAVDYSAVPAALVCVCSLAFAATHRRTTPTTATHSPGFATLPASREDRFIARVNSSFAARQRLHDTSDGPTFGNVEHRGQRL